tara:strand:- start:166 stop:1008 length:843 start_codon:yes stop_codon:yes gene_type:complete
MADETTSSTISELYTEIVAEAMFTASEQSIMKGLVRNYTIAGGGKSVEVPIYPTVSASAVSEASDLSNTAINPTSVTITASEVGIMTTLTDLARNSASRNVAQDIGRVFGEAIARKIDLDLTALFDGFSTSVGGSGAALSADTVAQAHANLRNSSVPMNDLALVIHPMVAHDLKRGMTNTYAGLDTDISNEALRSGFIGTLFGVPVFETANMANTGTAGDYKGAMFHRDALGLAMMQDLKIEVQRDASLRADEIVATAVYGVGELQDSYGIEILADSSIQ